MLKSQLLPRYVLIGLLLWGIAIILGFLIFPPSSDGPVIFVNIAVGIIWVLLSVYVVWESRRAGPQIITFVTNKTRWFQLAEIISVYFLYILLQWILNSANFVHNMVSFLPFLGLLILYIIFLTLAMHGFRENGLYNGDLYYWKDMESYHWGGLKENLLVIRVKGKPVSTGPIRSELKPAIDKILALHQVREEKLTPVESYRL